MVCRSDRGQLYLRIYGRRSPVAGSPLIPTLTRWGPWDSSLESLASHNTKLTTGREVISPMKIRDALIRATRSGLQAFVGAVAVSVIPLLKVPADIALVGNALAVAFLLGVATFCISIIQNVLEDNTKLPSLK